MDRDRGRVARASGDNVSDFGNVTAHRPEVCRETSVGTLLPTCRQQEDKLRAATLHGMPAAAHGFLRVVRPRCTGMGRLSGT